MYIKEHVKCEKVSKNTVFLQCIMKNKREKKNQIVEEIQTSRPLMPPTTKTRMTFWSPKFGFAWKV